MATPAGDSPEQEQEQEQHSAPSEHQMPQHRASMSTPNTTPTAGSGGLKMVAGYALERRLGSGSFATVYRGVKVLDSTGRTEFSAIKAISRSSEKLTKKVLENLELEISILRTYRHPNIVCLYDVQKTERHVYLILEYCAGGDVQQLIRSRKTGRLSERLTRRLIRDLAAGLKFLWGQELIHRDIKPQNLLLSGPLPLDEVNDPAKKSTDEDERMRVDFPSAQFSLKIADFGFARHLQTTSLAETLCGSPLYMAPEILQHQRYDAKADLWSAGTVLFEMISGRPPFHGENHIDLLRNIQRKAVRLPADVRVSKECVNLLRLLLNRNPLSRAGFQQFFDASDAFVALGCEGEAPADVDTGSIRSPSGFQLGPISEGDESQQMAGSGSAVAVESMAASRNNRYGEPVMNGVLLPGKNEESERNPPNSTSLLPPTSATNIGPSQKPSRMNIVSPPLVATASPTQQTSFNFAADGQQLQQERRPSHFSPLEPSPPGPRAYHVTTTIPPPFSLDGTHQQGSLAPSRVAGHTTNQSILPLEGQRKASPSSSDDDSGGFIMVEHGGNAVAASSHEQRGSGAPSQPWRQVAPGSRFVNKFSPPSSPGRSHHSNAIPGHSDARSRSSSPHPKGILGTSPGTGRRLVGMIGMALGTGGLNAPFNAGLHGSQFQNIEKFEAIGSHSPGSSSNMELAAKMLATAEDVGRRAVAVAHLGDTRAYLAMRLIVLNENPGSFQSSTPMEGLEEENEEGSNDGDTTSSNTLLASPGRRRTVSTDRSSVSRSSSRQRSNSTRMEEEDYDDDEMPFAVSLDDDDENASLVPMPTGQGNDVSKIAKASRRRSSGSSIDQISTHALIHVHFREALSCYIKALSMIKGAVGATQRVLAELKVQTSPATSSSESNRNMLALTRRCEVSHGWLGGQFKGVLERADAASTKLIELKNSTFQHPGEGAEAPANSINSGEIATVDELVYNHSLACGKDGAVKQLLGQNDAARSCYRSAGLLAETLLMESKVGPDDRIMLENLVQGFAERITELDSLVMQQSRACSASTSHTGSISIGSSNRNRYPTSVGATLDL